MGRAYAKCTVVIPCFNAEPYLEATIESVRAQLCKDYHLVIVDDASKDNTRALAHRLVGNDPNMTVIELDENHGRCYARNRGAEETTGPFVTFLDQDDTYHPSFLLETLNALESHQVFDAIKVLPNLTVEIDTIRYEAIANSLATTTIFRRPAFEFVGGWPESEIFRHHPGGCEDIALLALFSAYFEVGILHAKFYNYTLRPGNALDRFLKRSSVIDGQLHISGRTEQDVVMEKENARLMELLKARARLMLKKSSLGLMRLNSESK